MRLTSGQVLTQHLVNLTVVTTLTADGDVNDVTGTASTAANIITELGKIADAIPSAVYGAEDMTIYLPGNMYRNYIRALGGFGASGLGAAGTNDQGTQWYNMGAVYHLMVSK